MRHGLPALEKTHGIDITSTFEWMMWRAKVSANHHLSNSRMVFIVNDARGDSFLKPF